MMGKTSISLTWLGVGMLVALVSATMADDGGNDHFYPVSEYYKMLMEADEEAVARQVREVFDVDLEPRWEPKLRYLVDFIGDRQLREHIPALKRYAEGMTTTPATNWVTTSGILLNLWRLGEPREYFLDFAVRHGATGTISGGNWHARAALLILAYDPDEELLGMLEKAGFTATFAHGNYSREKHLSRMEIEERITFLADHARGSWNRVQLELFKRMPWGMARGAFEPGNTWARLRLLEEFRSNPEEVLRQLNVLEQNPEKMGFTRPEWAEGYIPFLRLYLKIRTERADLDEYRAVHHAANETMILLRKERQEGR